ncbi:MAG: hypothetical protein ACRELS_13580 [Candidatus Rokuibacteriota bacterium]
MRLATIDLGTNTVRLLIADVEPGRPGWRTVEQGQRVTRLGEGLADSGRLGEAPRARTRATVVEYVELARRQGAARVRIVATSAVREAVNGADFARGLEAATGERVSVVSGDEEARLTLYGILHGLPTTRGAMLAFDIGGGSTEYILARAGALAASTSLRLGVVPLAERFPFADGVEPSRFAALRGEIRARLARDLPVALRDARADRLVGTAGTVTTLAALDLGLTTYDATRVQGHALTRTAVECQLARLGALPAAARAALPCLEPGRADLILPGTAIVLETMTLASADVLTVSDFGLREGILVEAALG